MEPGSDDHDFVHPEASSPPKTDADVAPLAALVVLGKYLGMFDQRPQNSNVIYAISDEPMSAEEWKRQFVKPG